MRLKLTAVVFGFALSASLSAMAQTITSQNPATPVYTTNSAPVYYSMTPNGTFPVYNNTNSTPTLPMEQLVAGKNAPSYQYNQVQPYGVNNGNWYGGSGAMTASQEAQMQAQYQSQYNEQMQAQTQAAALQQQEYLNSLQQQQGLQALAQNAGLSPQQFNQIQQQQQQQAPKRRVVFNKNRNNPLQEPPRLFNPDQ